MEVVSKDNRLAEPPAVGHILPKPRYCSGTKRVGVTIAPKPVFPTQQNFRRATLEIRPLAPARLPRIVTSPCDTTLFENLNRGERPRPATTKIFFPRITREQTYHW